MDLGSIWTVIVDAGLKSAVLCAGGLLVAGALMRHSSAARRHVIYTGILIACLLLPVFSVILPHWRVLPQWPTPVAQVMPPAPVAMTVAQPVAFEPTPLPPVTEVPSQPAPVDVVPPAFTPQPTQPAWYAQFTLAQWLTFAWLAGAILFLLPILLGQLAIFRICRSAQQIHGAFTSSRCRMPMACGLFRPAIILPQDANTWTATRREAVIRHESEHLRRCDCLWQQLGQFARALYWFNPLIWLTHHRMLCEAERACDDAVLTEGSKPSDYAEHLLAIATTGRSDLLLASAAVAMARANSLEGRLLSILDAARSRRRATIRLTALCALIVIAAAVPLAMLRAQTATQPADQQTRIRALIYLLQNHNVFSRTDEWAGAIRELAQIGKPAVPDLVAELERTDRDAELRGLAFTLRAIGDPRAVPALIAALPRTRMFTSDCGITCTDPDLLKFMQEHDVSAGRAHPDDDFGYGRSICEIANALEKLTAHSEGKDYLGEPSSSDAKAEVARIGDLRKQAADRWTAWWFQNKDRFVSNEDEAKLSDGAASFDDITAAGLTVFGPTFPADRKPGPVVEITLPAQGGPADVGVFLSFSAGRAYANFEGSRWSNSSSAWNTWFCQRGVAADASVRLKAPGPTGAPQERFLVLTGHNVSVWQVDSARWANIDREFASGKPLDPGPFGPMGDFRLNSSRYPSELTDSVLPVTFLFDTSYGEKGILQIVATDPKAETMTLRYRLFGGPVAKYAAPLPPPDDRGATFGPVNSIVLNDYQSDLPAALNLRTGQTAVIPPSARKLAFVSELHKWMTDQKMDLVTRRYGTKGNGVGVLCGVGMPYVVMQTVQNSGFDRMTPGQVCDVLSRGREAQEGWLMLGRTPADRLPVTCAFLTKDGLSGLLQMTEVSDERGTIALRYKLVQGLPGVQQTPERRETLARLAGMERDAAIAADIARRDVDKALSQFAEQEDLTTPETTWAAMVRARIREDFQKLGDLDWPRVPAASLAQSWQQGKQARPAEMLAAYKRALASTKLVEVWTDSAGLAYTISWLDFPIDEKSPSGGYDIAQFAQDGQQWKRTSASATKSIETARDIVHGIHADTLQNLQRLPPRASELETARKLVTRVATQPVERTRAPATQPAGNPPKPAPVAPKMLQIAPSELPATRATQPASVGRLDFRAAVTFTAAGDLRISPQPVTALLARLTKNGPDELAKDNPDLMWMAVQWPTYIWVEIDTPDPSLIIGDYHGKHYALLSRNSEHTMLYDGTWGLTRAYVAATDTREPAVGFTFDDAGAERFRQFTSAHLKQSIACVLDGKVASVAVVATPMSRSGIISAQKMDISDAWQMIRSLNAGIAAHRQATTAPDRRASTSNPLSLYSPPSYANAASGGFLRRLMLGFEIRTPISPGGLEPAITRQKADDLVDRCQRLGPATLDPFTDAATWIDISDDLTKEAPGFIYARFSGRTFILLSNAQEHCLFAQPNVPPGQITSAQPITTAQSQHAVKVSVDAASAPWLADFSKRHLHQRVATVLLEKIVSVAPVSSEWNDSVVITSGTMTAAMADEFAAGLTRDLVRTEQGVRNQPRPGTAPATAPAAVAPKMLQAAPTSQPVRLDLRGQRAAREYPIVSIEPGAEPEFAWDLPAQTKIDYMGFFVAPVPRSDVQNLPQQQLWRATNDLTQMPWFVLGMSGDTQRVQYGVTPRADEPMTIGPVKELREGFYLVMLSGYQGRFIPQQGRQPIASAVCVLKVGNPKEAPKPDYSKLTPEQMQAKAQEWVEDFFDGNYRDITARRMIEWGKAQKLDNGNWQLRYKYEATIWNKDKVTHDKLFTFTPEGGFVSVADASPSQPAPAQPGQPAQPAPSAPPAPPAQPDKQVTPADRTKADELTKEGWDLWQKQQFAPAADRFAEAVKLNPNATNAWNGLGWSLFNSGRVDEAYAAFAKCVALAPSHPAALNGLGQIELQRGDLAPSEKHLLAASPTSSAAWWGLAKLYLVQGKYDEAAKWADRILNEDPSNADAKLLKTAAQEKRLPDELRELKAKATVMPPLVQRTASHMLSDFPDKVDLSTPESAWAAWQRANIRMDVQAVVDLSWVEIPPEEEKAFWDRERAKDPEGLRIYVGALAESILQEIWVDRDELATTISYLNFPKGKGRDPYSIRVFGKIAGQWKNLGEDRSATLAQPSHFEEYLRDESALALAPGPIWGSKPL